MRRFRRSRLGKLRPAFFAALDAEDRFNPRVEGRKIGVTDRPVLAAAVDIGRFEFEVAQAKRLASPKQRPAA